MSVNIGISYHEKHCLIIIALIAAVLSITLKRPEETKPTLDAPTVITQPAEYRLDQHRVIEVREEDGEIKYFEVVYEDNSDAGHSPALVSYAVNHIDDIKLSEGWSISLEKPSTVVVETGTGETIQREFGQQPPPVKGKVHRTVIKRNPVISGEPKAIPMDEIDPAE